MKRIHIEAEKCSGCRICEMVCSFRHWGRFSPSLSSVSVLKDDRYGLDYPVMCHQCEQCSASEACPTQALKQAKNGSVYVDEDVCTGCGACSDACGFGAVKLVNSRPIVCDLCGGEPLCVERCPTEALAFIDSEAKNESPKEAFERLLRRWGIAA